MKHFKSTGFCLNIEGVFYNILDINNVVSAARAFRWTDEHDNIHAVPVRDSSWADFVVEYDPTLFDWFFSRGKHEVQLIDDNGAIGPSGKVSEIGRPYDAIVGEEMSVSEWLRSLFFEVTPKSAVKRVQNITVEIY